MEEAKKIIEIECKYLLQSNLKEKDYLILEITGTLKNAVMAALHAKVFGKDRVIGVVMPHLRQERVKEVAALINFLGIKSHTIPITVPVASLSRQLAYENIILDEERNKNLIDFTKAATLATIAEFYTERNVGASPYPCKTALVRPFSETYLSDRESLIVAKELGLPEIFTKEELANDLS